MTAENGNSGDMPDATIGSLIERAIRAGAKAGGSGKPSKNASDADRNMADRDQPLDEKKVVKSRQKTTRPPHIIVVGNEKGGTGKSTVAMHLIVALLRDGFDVGAIDLDGRQGTLSRYFDNRRKTAAKRNIVLPQPHIRRFGGEGPGADDTPGDTGRAYLTGTLAGLGQCDYVVIDTPGSDSDLSRLAHGLADTLITPLNDSFVDLALLADVDPQTCRMVAPSTYAAMVAEQRRARTGRGGGPVDWIVLRNRLSALDSRNRQHMDSALRDLAPRLGFRCGAGFGERVIFRELYLQGLTLLDIRDEGAGVTLSMSHIAALQEVRALVEAVGLPERRQTSNRPATRMRI